MRLASIFFDIHFIARICPFLRLRTCDVFCKVRYSRGLNSQLKTTTTQDKHGYNYHYNYKYKQHGTPSRVLQNSNTFPGTSKKLRLFFTANDNAQSGAVEEDREKRGPVVREMRSSGLMLANSRAYS